MRFLAFLIFTIFLIKFGECDLSKCPDAPPNACVHFGDTLEDYIKLIDNYDDKERELKTDDFIRNHGYGCDNHEVGTKDGYILTLFHITNSPFKKTVTKYNKKGKCRSPYLILHGMCSSSHEWFVATRNNTLPLLMADEGFDIWVGNSRGNTYSPKHVSLSQDDDRYWDFTLDDQAFFDLPAMIDYILEKTKKKSLGFTGVCIGATAAMILLSERPEYNKKVNIAVMLGAVMFLKHTVSPPLTSFSPQLYHDVFHPVSRVNDTSNEISRQVNCDASQPKEKIKACARFFFGLTQFNPCHVDCTRFPFFMSRVNHMSMNLLLHFIQNTQTRRFARYKEKEFYKANKLDPRTRNRREAFIPKSDKNVTTIFDINDYDLSGLNTSCIVISGGQNIVQMPKDVAAFKTFLKANGNLMDSITVPDFGNKDFLFGMYARERAWDQLLPKLTKFDEKMAFMSKDYKVKRKSILKNVKLTMFQEMQPSNCTNTNLSDTSCGQLGLGLSDVLELFGLIDTEQTADTEDLVKKGGYKSEIHEVLTKDGYFLTLHRIKKKSKPVDDGLNIPKVVLFQHGFLSASHDWLLGHQKENVLPFILCDLNYDVWLGNSRGSPYSDKHVNLTQDDVNYWDFSFHEMGAYDLPAIIDYIVKTTFSEQIIYVGYSQGATSLLSGLSINPEYNKKIRLAFLMAPITFMEKTDHLLSKNPAETLSKFKDIITSDIVPEVTGAKTEVTRLSSVPNVGVISCSLTGSNSNNLLKKVVCGQLLFLLTDPSQCEMDCSQMPLYLNHNSRMSIKEYAHLSQLAGAKTFQPIASEFKGGKKVAKAEYDLSKIATDIFLFSGDNDKLSRPQDVREYMLHFKLAGFLQDHVVVKGFQHGDFRFSQNLRPRVYEDIIKVVETL